MTGLTSPRRILVLVGLILAMLIALPFVATDRYVLAIATQALIWALLASSWDLVSGYTGQASFGHAGFFLIGAYAPAIISKAFGVSVWVSLPMGMVITGLFGFLVAIPALRLRGHYLAIVTLAFAEITQLTANNWTALSGGTFGIHDFGGFAGLPADPLAYDRAVYGVVFVLVAASIAFMWFLCERSRVGDAFRATREDQTLAQALGINTNFYKLLAFTLSSAFAGLAGGLFAFDLQLVVPSIGSANTSAMIIGMAVFGGLGTIWGSAIGALLLFTTNEALRSVGLVYNLVLIGAVIIAFVIFIPDGIAGLITRRWLPSRQRRLDEVTTGETSKSGLKGTQSQRRTE